MKKVLLSLSFLFLITIFLNCENKDDSLAFEEESSIQKKTDFKTVPIDFTRSFAQDLEKSKSNKSSNGLGIIVDESTFQQINISQSKEKLNIVEVSTKYETIKSSLFQIEIDGVIQTVIEHEIPDVNSKSIYYSGNIAMTNIEGKLLGYYKFNNGEYIGDIQLHHGLGPDPTCWGIACGITLNEVVVTNNKYHTVSPIRNLGPTNWGGIRYLNRNHSIGLAYGEHYYYGPNRRKIEAAFEEYAPERPVDDLKDYLKCFDLSKSATLTIYARQPVKGSSTPVGMADGDVGHAFVTISQDGITRTFGFYPNGEGLKSMNGDSAIGNNSDEIYHTSVTRDISSTIFKAIMPRILKYPDTYDVYGFNCTNFARDLGNFAGMKIPSAFGFYPVGPGVGGQNPGKFGEVMRKMKSENGNNVKKTSGKSPKNSGECK